MNIRYVIADTLAGSPLPGRGSENIQGDLLSIQNQHFTVIISLFDASKHSEMVFQSLSLEKYDLRHISFEIPDYSVPSAETARRIVSRISEEMSEPNGKVLVHCGAGIGRTGMVLALYLKYCKNISGQDAIEQVRDTYCKTAVETSNQEELIRTLSFS